MMIAAEERSVSPLDSTEKNNFSPINLSGMNL